MTMDENNPGAERKPEKGARPIYRLFNAALHALHLVVIGFTLFGWISRETRMANLILILLTLGSWFVLGRWLGSGYCPVTDLHWKIRRAMGSTRIPDSYIKLLLDSISGKDLDPRRVNALTLVATLVAGTISLVLNVLDRI